MSTEFERWLQPRPRIIQEMARNYPPDVEYVIADDAPYAISCPGTIVSIAAYCEDGTIRVAIGPDDLRPEAIEHINTILHPQGRDYEQMKGTAHSAHVDPQYLLPLPHKRETT